VPGTDVCPHCKGRVGKRWRGDSLEAALAAHIELAHAKQKVPDDS
jgi:hypothetical protein